MATYSLHWTAGSPQELADHILRAAEMLPDMVEESVSDAAPRAETEMKDGAPWQDRTTNARSGLFAKCERVGNVIKLHLGGTVEYQPHLELGTKFMRKFAIIVPMWRVWREKLLSEVAKDVMKVLQR